MPDDGRDLPPDGPDVGVGVRGRLAVLVGPLRSPILRRLTIAFLVNELGDGISLVVLPLVVYASTGSGVATGVSFAVVQGATVVGRPIGGLLADRVDRFRLLRVTFVVRALLLGTAVVIGSDMVVVACLVAASLVGSVDNPSAEAAIRARAGDAFQQVATIRKLSRAMSGVVGLAAGGALVGTVGVPTAIATDVATFVVALLVLPPGGAHGGAARERPAGPRMGWWAAAGQAVGTSLADAREGIAHLRSHVDLRVTAVAEMAMAGLVASLLTVAVVWLDGLSGAPDGAYGFALAGYSAGSIAGLLVAGMIAWRVSVPVLAWRTFVVIGVVCLLGVVGADWRMLTVSWLVWGIALGPLDVVMDARVVARTPQRLLGRTYGGLGTLLAAGQVVGALAAGLVVDLVGPRLVIVVLSAAFLVVAVGLRWWAVAPAGSRSG